jgi:hypothetical protein
MQGVSESPQVSFNKESLIELDLLKSNLPPGIKYSTFETVLGLYVRVSFRMIKVNQVPS